MRVSQLFCGILVLTLLASATVPTAGAADWPGNTQPPGVRPTPRFTPKPTPDPAVNRPPLQPVAMEPPNGAILRSQGEFVILRATPFRDYNPPSTPNGRHKYSQWMVFVYESTPYPTASGSTGTNDTSSFAPVKKTIVDSGPTTKSLTTFKLPKKLLKSGTHYFWTVRYADASGEEATQWSPWSTPARFVIAPELIKDLEPELKLGSARPGMQIYDTPGPIILRLPQALWSQTTIRTRTGDAKTSGPGTLISFSSDLPVSVFVAYDDRATTVPEWLWTFKPYRPIVPLLERNGETAGGGAVTASGANQVPARRGEVSLMPVLPPGGPGPQLAKMEVSDKEARLRRLLVKHFKPGEPIELGMNLPEPGVDTKTTATLRMYGVIVQPLWKYVITPQPQPPPVQPATRPGVAGVKPPATPPRMTNGTAAVVTGTAVTEKASAKVLAGSGSGPRPTPRPTPAVTPATRPTPRPTPAVTPATRPTPRPTPAVTPAARPTPRPSVVSVQPRIRIQPTARPTPRPRPAPRVRPTPTPTPDPEDDDSSS